MGRINVTSNQTWTGNKNGISWSPSPVMWRMGWGRARALPSVQHVRPLVGCSWAKLLKTLKGQFLTKHPNSVEIISLEVNHLPHLAENWAKPSRDTLSALYILHELVHKISWPQALARGALCLLTTSHSS